MPGIGARTLTSESEAREFVLREKANGNQTISIIEDGHLFRLSRATRIGNNTVSDDLFVTRIDALSGFTHSRFDWLDKTRILWYILAFTGLLLTVISALLKDMPYSNFYVFAFAFL